MAKKETINSSIDKAENQRKLLQTVYREQLAQAQKAQDAMKARLFARPGQTIRELYIEHARLVAEFDRAREAARITYNKLSRLNDNLAEMNHRLLIVMR